MLSKKDIVLIILILVSALGCYLVLPFLPAEIPMHWGLNGQVNRFGSHNDFMWMSILPLGILALMIVIPFIDPRKDNYKKHSKGYNILKIAIVVFLVGLNWLIILYSLGLISRFDNLMVIGVALLFIVIGNYMPQIRHNYTYGIKNPWTLADEVVWTKTHRLGGLIFMLVGIIIIPVSFISTQITFIILFAGSMLLVFGTTIYSLVLFKKREKEKMTDKLDEGAK